MSKKSKKKNTHIFSFRSKLWKHEGAGGWFFVTVPKKTSQQIRQAHGLSEEGWGRLKTTASIGGTSWPTALWYDTKYKSYLLPIRVMVRKKETLNIGAQIVVQLQFEQEPRLISLSKLRS